MTNGGITVELQKTLDQKRIERLQGIIRDKWGGQSDYLGSVTVEKLEGCNHAQQLTHYFRLLEHPKHSYCMIDEGQGVILGLDELPSYLMNNNIL
jgi:hypothetical protein